MADEEEGGVIIRRVFASIRNNVVLKGVIMPWRQRRGVCTGNNGGARFRVLSQTHQEREQGP